MVTWRIRVGGVMVAALVLGTNGAIRGGSSPLPRTKLKGANEYLEFETTVILQLHEVKIHSMSGFLFKQF